MKTTKRLAMVLLILGLLGVGVGGGLAPAAAPADCPNCLVAALLPRVACKVDASQPTKTFCGEPLEIAATPVKQSYLQFDPSALPREARVHSWILRLYLRSQNDRDGRQLVRLYPVQPTAGWENTLTWANKPAEAPASIAAHEVNKDVLRVDFERTLAGAESDEWLQTHAQGLSLMLRSPSPGQDYTYYATSVTTPLCTLGSEQIPCVNAQPKLIVKYYLPATLPASNWPQYRYDPQHTGRLPWRSNADATALQRKEVYSPQGYIMGDPVLYQGTLLLHTQLTDRGDQKFFISAVHESGAPLWDQHLGDAAKFQPVVDQKGRLYVVTENTLVVLDLEDGGKILRQPKWKDLLKTQEAVSVRSTPTLGFNGALYVSTNRGVFAVTPYPELNVWWQYTTGENAFGPIALSQDEGTVYVTDGAAGALVALDNTDGAKKWTQPILNIDPAVGAQCQKGTPKDVENFQTYPPAPVVGKDGELYVTDGHYLDNVQHPGRCLHVFTADGTRMRSIAAGGPDALLSQVVMASTGQAYVIAETEGAGKGKLCAWSAAQPTAPPCASNPEDTLNPHNILVMDGNDRIYVLDSISDPQRVRGYTSQFARLFDLPVPKTAGAAEGRSTNFMRNLLVAPDGTLYTRNQNHLFALAPRDLSAQELQLDAATLQQGNQTAFMAQKSLVVEDNATIAANTSVILKSGGTILFKPGFTVNKGARLSTKTGF